VSGTITTYGSAVSLNGRTGYPIMSMSGTRQFIGPRGVSSTPITGVSNDWIAQQQGWTMDQLFYPTAPYFSSLGALYKYSGMAQSTLGFITADNVVKMLYPTGSSTLTEELYFNNGLSLTNLLYTGMTVSVAADNGGSAATILSSACGITLSGVTFPTSSTSTGASLSSSGGGGGGGGGGSSSGGLGGGGSSGLSGGAIAGIVIGGVVGVLLLCTLCMFFVLRVAKDKQTEAAPTSKYDTQTDMSKVGVSQVELAHTNESSRVGGDRIGAGEEHTEI